MPLPYLLVKLTGLKEGACDLAWRYQERCNFLSIHRLLNSSERRLATRPRILDNYLVSIIVLYAPPLYFLQNGSIKLFRQLTRPPCCCNDRNRIKFLRIHNYASYTCQLLPGSSILGRLLSRLLSPERRFRTFRLLTRQPTGTCGMTSRVNSLNSWKDCSES